MDITVKGRERKTIRELSVGDYYITVGNLRRFNGNERAVFHHIRLRTEDPYKSQTMWGTPVTTFPSELVHPVIMAETLSPEYVETKEEEVKDEEAEKATPEPELR